MARTAEEDWAIRRGYEQKYRETHRDRCRAACSRWAKANPEKVKAYQAAWAAANPAVAKAIISRKNRKQRELHPEKIKESKRAWAIANPEKMKAIKQKASRKYREAHKEKTRAASLNWYREHYDEANLSNLVYRTGHAEDIKMGKLKSKYGLTAEQYEQILVDQGGVCAICGEIRGTNGLGVDHDHATGKVRGRLCQPCNLALGCMKDNPVWLQNAINYLRRNQDDK